ncbi:MAG TPA: carboxypeptidase regulatory-like domain-containing protein [Longimicrobiaceae bacterium]|jgi:hypothetical protein
MRQAASFVVLLLLALLRAGPAGAQIGSTTDIVRGQVTGSAGEPVAGAAVTVTSAETGVRRTATTDAQGRYTVVFPDGGGQYQVQAAAAGLPAGSRRVARVGDEDVLQADVRLATAAVALEGITVTARRTPPPSGRDPAATEREVSGEALNRLPVDPADVTSLATLTPGVTALGGGDSLQLAFSVLGQGSEANQMTLDGVSFGGDAGGGLGVPQEAVRSTRVVTNTYDVSQGQFSGGQISTTTRGGTNNVQGSFSYLLRDPALQWTESSDAFGGAFSQNRFSGGVGGPIVRDRLFYFGSAAVQRRSSGLRSLASADPLALQSLGVDPDSVARFLSLLGAKGIYPAGVAAPTDQVNTSYTLLGRVDYNLSQRHTLTLRGNGNWSEQGASRIGALGLPQSGADVSSTSGGAMLSLTSRFGNGWINELRSFYSTGSRETEPYAAIPGGRVRITSELEDGTRSVSTLSFGGAGTATESSDRTVEVANELSLLLGQHRLRVGGLVNSTSNRSLSGSNLLGSFTYNSLAAFAADSAASFTRSLAQREREAGGINAAVYVGDTWRPRQSLQLTYGLRLEGSRASDEPAYNPRVEALFGRRTDAIPSDFALSPRVGFTYTMRRDEEGPPVATVRGGFGEFRSRPLWNLFAAARDATGLPESQAQLTCIGGAVPVPDWAAFQGGEEYVPGACLDGGTGVPTGGSGRGSSVTVFDPDFAASRSWRASLGFQRNFTRAFRVSVDGVFAQGVSLQGVRDLNLNTTPRFALAQEGGRPVFVPQGAIVAETGEVGYLSSRLHPELGQVTEYNSDLRSRSGQVTVGLSGAVPQRRLFGQLNYTFARSRDQGTSGGGFGRGFGGGFGGFGGFGGGLPLTAGNPNEAEWATSDFDRPHQVVLTLGHQLRPWMDYTVVGRFTSGSPFTPTVGGDVNGDGARNDRAFIFDPATTADPALAAGISRLLEGSSDRVRECLRSQLGEIAGRNSCRNPWSYGLDLRANVRPTLPRLGNRLTLSLDAVNTLGGLDRLFHGSGDLRGWGEQNRADPVLLYPRGFDPATASFRYEVNESFGDARRQTRAFRNPFQLQIQARLAVGRQQQGGFGGIAGAVLGGGGGGGGGGGSFDPRVILERALANPLRDLLSMSDTLQLTPEQVARLEGLADSLQVRLDTVQAQAERELDRAAGPGAARGGNRAAGQGGGQGGPGAVFQAIGPRLQEARTASQAAMREAQKVLTPAQWQKVPEEIRNPGRGFGPGGGGQQEGRRPGGGRP